MMATTKPADRLRIAVLNRSFVPTGGGAERYSIALVEQLAQRHEIHVFAQKIEHQWPGVTYHKLWAPLSKPRWINQLWFGVTSWWATRRGFDVVHSHENTWHGNVQTVHVLPVKYTLFQGRSGWHLALRWVKVLSSPRLLAYLWLERRRYDTKDGRSVVVTSPSLGATMVATYPKVASAIQLIPPGVMDVPGLADAASRRDARLRLGLPNEGVCLLFVGNDYRKKGLITLMEALGQLPNYMYLTVVGNPAHIPQFFALAKNQGLDKRIYFLGALTHMSDAYVAADALIHPTLEDTFAMVVLEALAHGLPVIVSGPKYCGISGLLQDGVDAVILDNPRESCALAEAAAVVFSDATMRQTLSTAGSIFAKNYLWATLANQQESLYFSSVRWFQRS